MASTDPWWVIPSTSEAGAPTFIFFQGTKAEAQARASRVTEVSAQQNLFGPYDTRTDAEEAAKGKGPNPVTVPNTNINPFAPFEDTAHALTAFYEVVTNGKMWRSLGWLLLGVLIMILGLGLLLKDQTPAGAILSALKAA
jgi:hypothetical protein